MDNILKKIHQSALKFLVPLTSGETYPLIVREAVKLVKADHGSILLAQGNELKRIYATSPIPFQVKTRKSGNTYRAFREQRALIADISDTGKAHPVLKKAGIQSSIIIPLSYHHKAIGVLVLNSRKKAQFNKKEFEILKLFGSLASLAIRKTQLYDETQKALEARDLFISMAAHELRTPLTTINGYSQLLYSKFAHTDTPEARWITDLSWETLRLSYLVNELLEVDRIKSGQIQYSFQECSLREVIRRALADFHFTHPEYKVVLEDRTDNGSDVIIGDFNKLLQLTINLLDNAAKFSPPTSEIVIQLKSKKPNIYLAVKDRGKGIAKKDLSDIFEKFYKGADHTKEGMGLGLFLSKNIIKQHHGEISIHSKPNKGTIVQLRLPATKLTR